MPKLLITKSSYTVALRYTHIFCHRETHPFPKWAYNSPMPTHQISLTSQTGAATAGTLSVGAIAFGALAVGAFAIGALAIGALAIRKLAVGKARVKNLHIDRLTIGQLDIQSTHSPNAT